MLNIKNYFVEKGADPYQSKEWIKTNASVMDEKGILLFTQKNVEFPKDWSPSAREIVVSRYFNGEQGTNQRENSLKDIVGRVSQTISGWGEKQKYFTSEHAEIFKKELEYISINQLAAFNSPVWFNVGTHLKQGRGSNSKKNGYVIQEGKIVDLPLGQDIFYPQTSACFIQKVEDTMEGIMQLATNEAMLFKHGSGTGTNYSSLRSSKEKISGGGKPSGPLAYWSFYDKVAGIVKSGGKTRRAAKMGILNIDHPDILEFINSKKEEEKKLHILIDNGVPWTEAQESVNYQNTNISIRISDDFMKIYEADGVWKTKPIHSFELVDQMPEYKAKFLLEEIASATHFSGDPGVQFDTNINRWHTCPNSEKINASNPCSEYMFIDNSSCNLASINVMKFLKEDGTFDIEGFNKTTKNIIISQDSLIDNSSFPTKEIAENSYNFRPLGLGYANMGSLFMNLGLAYDSNEARAIASSLTALLTGQAYETSTEMAKEIGTFNEYKKNKEPMLKVMNMHKEAIKTIDKSKIPKGLENILEEAEQTWERVIEKGEKYGFRNAQATVLAPTGTIGFMMDCDTKGIEPEIGLVQTKLLAEGGILRLTNSGVKPALTKLGYSIQQINEIDKYISGHSKDFSKKEDFEEVPELKKEHIEKIKEAGFMERREKLRKLDYSTEQQNKICWYLDGYETMEGAPHIKEEHLSIFDCSNKPKWAKRTISPQGHIKMMAAAQPFLSGAISKTVNLPKEATVEEVKQIYIDSWKMGLKSIAIYRDQSKRVQPLNFSDNKDLENKVIGPARKKLPTTRKGIIHKFDLAGHEGYLKIGEYENGSPGEIFIEMSKQGSTIKGLMDSIAIQTSMNLQYGVPMEKIITKMRNQKFPPNGLVYEGHPEIKIADSIIDYIAQFLQKQYLPDWDLNGINKDINKQENTIKEEETNKNEEIEEESLEEKGGFCGCGNQMIKKGPCKEVCGCGAVKYTDCGGG